jgi:hypothetical protein
MKSKLWPWKKSCRENLLIDAAIAGHETAHKHLKLVDLNCKDGIKLKMVKKLNTIDEMKMLVWDLQKFGASSTYYWLKNPLQVKELLQGLLRIIHAQEAHETRQAIGELLEASSSEGREVDLRSLASPDVDGVNDEIAKLSLGKNSASSSSSSSRRPETADEASRSDVISPDESLQRPRSLF